MSLDNVKQFQRTTFQIPRYRDKVFVEKAEVLAQDGGYKIEKPVFQFTFADQSAEFSGGARDDKLDQLLNLGPVSTYRTLSN